MKSIISEMKNTPERMNSILDEAGERISNLEDKVAGKNQNSQKEKNFKKWGWFKGPLWQRET